MGNANVEYYKGYVYAYIRRFIKLYWLLLNAGRDIHTQVFYANLAFSFMAEVLRGIEKYDPHGFERFRLDTLTPEFLDSLNDARNTTFHFGRDMKRAMTQEQRTFVNDAQFVFVMTQLDAYAKELFLNDSGIRELETFLKQTTEEYEANSMERLDALKAKDAPTLIDPLNDKQPTDQKH